MRIALYHNLPSGGGKRALYEMTKRLVQSLFTVCLPPPLSPVCLQE